MKNTDVKYLESNVLSFLNNDNAISTLHDIRRGIERELIRTTSESRISNLSHPEVLGSALTHPYITTDFAEAQLELVTPAMTERKATFDSLASLHHFVATHLPEDEIMWGASMPPALPSDDEIKIASYGSSNAGLHKVRYREGLANRYGKRMQLISGIHYNFSLPDSFWATLHAHLGSELSLNDFISERYFHLIRNVLRNGWVIPYLFGASPAVDKSYLADKEHPLATFDADTYYLPWATSLRLSNMGYSSNEQSLYPTSFNSKQEYLTDLCHALTTPSARYVHLNSDQQLNGSVLQLENELYGSIRPKIVNDQLRPLYAMCHHGIQYIELRSLDNNPLLPLGISEEQSHFLDVFLTYNALAPSPELTDDERVLIARRQELVAIEGRKEGLLLPTLQGDIELKDLGFELLDAMRPVATWLDNAFTTEGHKEGIEREYAKLMDSKLTPSSKILAMMKEEKISYKLATQRLSEVHFKQHKNVKISEEEVVNLTRLVIESLVKQQQMEAQQDMSFDEFIQEKNHLQCDCEIEEAVA
ncbi:glutamate--cysteine ligase [Aliivibrio finisterrensis]|uniref:glutamate--cysteine ligase n=1 Tax=Aliivibrio finisterrensis TaxID=511998 RepID=UPI00102213CC|nr:glutamate--cysteine ligase [Aliivibrio finisterrensis]RYU68069.1 glutamate--cysteine ligase [Aliivibrio finisterrensis]RYU71737.1 glutamate--cysteine ligase [Aliivibrio finisterrensis]RYU75412.1 glutamate--cysteine ligase [Aliivibrio finisterrensis]